MKIDVIVPCYNEGPRVGRVLKVLCASPNINKVIFVDDGSTDNSSEVAKSFNKIKVIKLKKNVGKGGAVRKGLQEVETPAVFLCDADLRGFKQDHIKEMVKAHIKHPKAMIIGVRSQGAHTLRYRAWDKHFPKYDGERILPTKVLERILRSENAEGYGLEAWMNYYYKKNKKEVKWAILDGLKDGVFRRKGIKGIANEFAEVALTYKEIYKDSLKTRGKKYLKTSLNSLEVF